MIKHAHETLGSLTRTEKRKKKYWKKETSYQILLSHNGMINKRYEKTGGHWLLTKWWGRWRSCWIQGCCFLFLVSPDSKLVTTETWLQGRAQAKSGHSASSWARHHSSCRAWAPTQEILSRYSYRFDAVQMSWAFPSLRCFPSLDKLEGSLLVMKWIYLYYFTSFLLYYHYVYSLLIP